MENYFKVKFKLSEILHQPFSEIENLPFYEIEYYIDLLKEKSDEEKNGNKNSSQEYENLQKNWKPPSFKIPKLPNFKIPR